MDVLVPLLGVVGRCWPLPRNGNQRGNADSDACQESGSGSLDRDIAPMGLELIFDLDVLRLALPEGASDGRAVFPIKGHT
ncbi:hypothetical protein B0G69_5761 [Paraburkholderia sp. RAU2J]|nr:hypothetical protein B0G69_5761 [Paraburkholderia sp. RAU2J]